MEKLIVIDSSLTCALAMGHEDFCELWIKETFCGGWKSTFLSLLGMSVTVA